MEVLLDIAPVPHQPADLVVGDRGVSRHREYLFDQGQLPPLRLAGLVSRRPSAPDPRRFPGICVCDRFR